MPLVQTAGRSSCLYRQEGSILLDHIQSLVSEYGSFGAFPSGATTGKGLGGLSGVSTLYTVQQLMLDAHFARLVMFPG